jgi:CheY-like chemotaxis protein
VIHETVTIFLVEDDIVDVKCIQRGMASIKLANPIIRAQDGVEALKMLREGKVPQPYLILLDLNMPRMSGIEFLEELRRDPALTHAIVFVLTTSNDERDKLAAYDKLVAGYILKSSAGADFVDLVHMLDAYWKIVEFPPRATQQRESA